MARELVHREDQHFAYVRKKDGTPNTGLVIFVHGFRGSYLSTWGQLSDFLEQHADSDEKLEKWDYLFLGYRTYSIDTFLEIARIVSSQWDKASKKNSPFDRNAYSKLALFGHSLGTLGLRQLICNVSEQPDGLLDALSKVVLFGSPLNGSPLTGLAAFAPIADAIRGQPAALSPTAYRIADALKRDSAELQMLCAWGRTVRKMRDGKLGPTKVILGTDDHVVGTGGLAAWQDDCELTTPLNHSQLVKVSSDGTTKGGTVLDELRELPA